MEYSPSETLSKNTKCTPNLMNVCYLLSSSLLTLQLVPANTKILLSTQWWILVLVNHGSHLESSNFDS